MWQRHVDDEVFSVDTDLIAKEAVEGPSGTAPPEGALKADIYTYPAEQLQLLNIWNIFRVVLSH